MSRSPALTLALGLVLSACGVPIDSDSNLDDHSTDDGNGTIAGDGGGSAGGSEASGGSAAGDGDLGSDSGAGGTGGVEIIGPVVSLFQHCDYGGWGIELQVGDYTTEELEALGALDDDASSVRVEPGFEVILFDEDDFTGSSVTITSDSACTVTLGFNDLASSVRVQAVSDGSGGNPGSGGSDGTGGSSDDAEGPISCQPAFETACKPSINFDNQHSEGGGALFDDLFPDVVSEMKDIACTVCSILYRDPEEIPQNRRHSTINLTIDAHDGVAYASGNSITMSVNHLDNYTNPDSAYVEYRGILVHETVHLYQHYGTGGTGEGMADAVRIRVGLYGPGRCNPGGTWRDAYTTSGCFYSWLTGPSSYHSIAHPMANPNLLYEINAALAGTSGEGAYTAVASLLQTTFGQDVETLWDLYQDDL